MQKASPQFLTALFCGLAAATIWGAWPVLSRLSVQQSLNPYDITALRFGVAGLLLLPVILRRGFAGLKWWQVLLLASGAGVPYVLTAVIGLSTAPAAHSGIIIPSAMLIASSLGAWLFLNDRPPPERLAGLFLVIAGILMTGWDGLLKSLESTGILGSDLLFVICGILWASYTLAARAWKMEALHSTAIVSVVSMVFYLPIYLVSGKSTFLVAPAEEILFQGVFQGVFAAIGALLFYTRAIAILGAARGALYTALVPGIAVLLAIPLLGEMPSHIQFAGVFTVTLGMGIAFGLFRLIGRRTAKAGA